MNHPAYIADLREIGRGFAICRSNEAFDWRAVVEDGLSTQAAAEQRASECFGEHDWQHIGFIDGEDN